MTPIYTDCINFFEDMGLKNGVLREGYYWLDNMIIKYFDRRGNTHNLCKVNVSEDLSISFKFYSDKYYYKAISWKELVQLYEDRLVELESHA